MLYKFACISDASLLLWWPGRLGKLNLVKWIKIVIAHTCEDIPCILVVICILIFRHSYSHTCEGQIKQFNFIKFFNPCYTDTLYDYMVIIYTWKVHLYINSMRKRNKKKKIILKSFEINKVNFFILLFFFFFWRKEIFLLKTWNCHLLFFLKKCFIFHNNIECFSFKKKKPFLC